MWLPDQQEYAGFYTENIDKGIASGLTFQPLSKTIRDTLEWDKTRQVEQLRAGLTPEKEHQLLRKWHAITADH